MEISVLKSDSYIVSLSTALPISFGRSEFLRLNKDPRGPGNLESASFSEREKVTAGKE